MGERDRIDPENQYGGGGPARQFERWADQVLSWFPKAKLDRTRDAIQVDWAGTRGVVILLTPESMEIRLPTVEVGYMVPSEPSSVLWKRLSLDDLNLQVPEAVRELIKKAERARSQQFVLCKHCAKSAPIEFRIDHLCHDCAVKHEGVVF